MLECSCRVAERSSGRLRVNDSQAAYSGQARTKLAVQC